MPSYRVETASRRVDKQIAQIPKTNRDRILAVLEGLEQDPRPPGIKQLNQNIYRLRVGDYRIIYKVFDEERIVLIGKAARRTETTYRE